jgi:hypothetical protein
MFKDWPNSFWLDAHDRSALVASFADRGLDLSQFETRTERHRYNNGLEEEIYLLRRYLFTLEDAGLLNYPITLKKAESPDFQGSMNGATYGIEVTEATSPADQREMTLAETHDGPTPRGSYGGRYKSGSFGFQDERDLAADVIKALRRKRAKANKWSTSISTLDLLLYANGNHWPSEVKYVAAILEPLLRRWEGALNKGTSIQRIAVIKGRSLIIWKRSEALQIFEVSDRLHK